MGKTIERYSEVHNLKFQSAFVEYVIDYLAGASFGLIIRWIRNDFRETPEKLADLYAELSRPGLVQTLLSGKL